MKENKVQQISHKLINIVVFVAIVEYAYLFSISINNGNKLFTSVIFKICILSLFVSNYYIRGRGIHAVR